MEDITRIVASHFGGESNVNTEEREGVVKVEIKQNCDQQTVINALAISELKDRRLFIDLPAALSREFQLAIEEIVSRNSLNWYCAVNCA